MSLKSLNVKKVWKQSLPTVNKSADVTERVAVGYARVGCGMLAFTLSLYTPMSATAVAAIEIRLRTGSKTIK